MPVKISTGLRNTMLGTGSMKTALDDGFIKLYSGAVPATADAAVGGTLLCTISVDGDGLTFSAPAGGVMAKTTAEVWSGAVGVTGTPTFYRHVADADDGTLSTTAPRIQGEVGTVGKELNMTDITFTVADIKYIDFYTVALPTL